MGLLIFKTTVRMKAIEFLKKNQSDTSGKWREEAECRRRSARWLSYSAMISILVKNRMSEIGITQVHLAEKLGCTQQHISTLLKGKSNMTIETIAKLEEALDFDIIGKAFISVDGYGPNASSSCHVYLSDSEQAPYGDKK